MDLLKDPQLPKDLKVFLENSESKCVSDYFKLKKAKKDQVQQSPPGLEESMNLFEEFDPFLIASEDKILDFANWLGMDLEEDKDLFWIPRAALIAPLPPNWKPRESTKDQKVFYFNFETGESTWDHPCDTLFKQLYEVEKRRKMLTRQVMTG